MQNTIRMARTLIIFLFLFITTYAFAQDNYEIQVYGSETVPNKATMVELHSNYTSGGSLVPYNGVFPTHHLFHETIEITHGFTNCLEIGFYFFNSLGSEGRTNYVGSHIRPRIRAPQYWHLPVGLSLSTEVGYQKPSYSEDSWTLEIRPIVDKTFKWLYLAFNPTLDKSLRGLNSRKGFIFSPNLKGQCNINNVWGVGIEYYGSIGTLFNFLPYQEEQHQLFAAADVTFSTNWELNFGYGVGFTPSTDTGIVKVILGYRIK